MASTLVMIKSFRLKEQYKERKLRGMCDTNKEHVCKCGGKCEHCTCGHNADKPAKEEVKVESRSHIMNRFIRVE